ILMPAIRRIESETKKPILGIVPKINHHVPEEDTLDGQKKGNIANRNKNSEAISIEIDKVSKVIESTINIEYILRDIMK
ncbi:MAG: hypothetical protein WKF36_05980, partial [Candidatus Nitrosocosmicus sp.]